MKKTLIIVAGLVLAVALGIGFYRCCVPAQNEAGSLGMDGYGRQMFLQSLGQILGDQVKIASDPLDHPFYYRLLRRPETTTIRLYDQADILPSDESIARAALESSCDDYLSSFESINLTREKNATNAEIREAAGRQGINTMAGMLAGYGFKRYEIFKNGKKVIDIDLKEIADIKDAGGQGL